MDSYFNKEKFFDALYRDIKKQWDDGTLKGMLLSTGGHENFKEAENAGFELYPYLEAYASGYIDEHYGLVDDQFEDPELNTKENLEWIDSTYYEAVDIVFEKILNDISKERGWGCEGCDYIIELGDGEDECRTCTRGGGKRNQKDNYTQKAAERAER